MSEKGEQIGIITEIGDLGLGFDPLSEQDQEKIKLETNKNNKEDK
jgi:hypothetical protein